MKLYFILLSFLFVGVCHAQKVTRINSNESNHSIFRLDTHVP